MKIFDVIINARGWATPTLDGEPVRSFFDDRPLVFYSQRVAWAYVEWLAIHLFEKECRA